MLVQAPSYINVIMEVVVSLYRDSGFEISQHDNRVLYPSHQKSILGITASALAVGGVKLQTP